MDNNKTSDINDLSEDEIIRIVRENTSLFLKLNDKWINNKNVVKAVYDMDREVYSLAGEELKKDREFALFAIKQNIYAFNHVSKELRHDTDFLKEALKISTDLLAYINQDEDVLKDRELVKEILSKSGDKLMYFENLNGDEEIVKIAVKSDGLAIFYANEDFLNNRDVVLLAVAQKGMILKKLSEKFKADKEIVKLSVASAVSSMEHMSDDLKTDKDFIIEIIQSLPPKKEYQGGYNFYFEFIDHNLQQDNDVIAEALNKDFGVIKYIDEEKRTSKDFLYLMRSVIEKNAVQYPEYSDLLNSFEREKDLLGDLKNIDKALVVKRKKRI